MEWNNIKAQMIRLMTEAECKPCGIREKILEVIR